MSESQEAVDVNVGSGADLEARLHGLGFSDEVRQLLVDLRPFTSQTDLVQRVNAKVKECLE